MTGKKSSIRGAPIDPSEILAEVKDDLAGGTVLFVGTIRSRSGGRRVDQLEYQVYAKMAEKRMREIESEVKKRWPVKRISMVHRTGVLGVGEVSVVVAVSSEHRAEAFEACRYAIDRIKSSLPLWKREGSGKKRAWVKGTPIVR